MINMGAAVTKAIMIHTVMEMTNQKTEGTKVAEEEVASEVAEVVEEVITMTTQGIVSIHTTLGTH